MYSKITRGMVSHIFHESYCFIDNIKISKNILNNYNIQTSRLCPVHITRNWKKIWMKCQKIESDIAEI